MRPFWRGFWYGANVANWPKMIRELFKEKNK